MTSANMAKPKKPLTIMGVFMFLQALASLGLVVFTVIAGLAPIGGGGEFATAAIWLVFGLTFAFCGLSCLKYTSSGEKTPGKTLMYISGVWHFVYGFIAQIIVNFIIIDTILRSIGPNLPLNHSMFGFALLLQIFSLTFLLGGIVSIHYAGEIKTYKSALSFSKALSIIDSLVLIIVALTAFILLDWLTGLLITLGALTYMFAMHVVSFIGPLKNKKAQLAFLEKQAEH